jgi:hypothetical protein
MRRSGAFRPKPPPLVAKRMEEALSSRMCLVQEVGPTCFIVKPLSQSMTEGVENASDAASKPSDLESSTPATVTAAIPLFKVRIGESQTCTCGDRELCVHILFVTLKVFRLEPSNPIIWQKHLTEAEITKLLLEREAKLRGRLAGAVKPAAADARCAVSVDSVVRAVISWECIATRKSDLRKHEATTVVRKPLSAGETCPICMDDMTVDEALTWCRFSCGSSVHNKCMKVWAEHKTSSGDKVSCPLCRQEWRPGQVPLALQLCRSGFCGLLFLQVRMCLL